MRHIFRFLMIVSCMATAFQILVPADRALAALEDVLLDKGSITEEQWEEIKAEKERERAERGEERTRSTWVRSWVDSVVWSGNLRLRYEQFWRDGEPGPVGNDRTRFRVQIRFGPTIRMGDFKIGVRLSTGTEDQTSRNQTFQDGFSDKDIRFDRVFAAWTPSFLKQRFTIMGGKMPNLFLKRRTSDLVWDHDITPEGFQEQLNYKVGDTTFYGDFGQFILDETNDNKFPFQLAWEGGVKGTLKKRFNYRLAVHYYDNVNVDTKDIDEPNPQNGNTRLSGGLSSLGGVLVNDYNVLMVGGDIGTQVMGIPVGFQFDWVKNLVSPTSCSASGLPNMRGQCNPGNAVVSGQDSGYQIGGRIGKIQKAGSWGIFYWYKWLQADATISSFADSDFGDGGTNRWGNIIRGRYQITDFLLATFTYYNTKPLVRALCGVSDAKCLDDIDRMQLNLTWKF